MTDFHKLFPGSGQGKEYDFLQHQFAMLKPNSVLDYGAGKGGTTRWLNSLGYPTTAYDPYWPEHNNTTVLDTEYDALFTADVLEHIELTAIPWDTFKQLSKQQLHIIDLTPAKKRLPDGRNAHITLLEEDEWIEQFHTNMGGNLRMRYTYATPDPNYEWRNRLCLHIEL